MKKRPRLWGPFLGSVGGRGGGGRVREISGSKVRSMSKSE